MQSIRVLIVEDDIATRAVTRITLQVEGYLVAEAANGIEAMRILNSEDPPDVVLLDLAMPRMDGFAFLEAINAMRPTPPSSVIVVSADRTSGVASELMSLGAAGFVRKPLGREDLRNIMKIVLARRASQSAIHTAI